jgi:alpha-beta hydrolase superfamily lysophospholipase
MCHRIRGRCAAVALYIIVGATMNASEPEKISFGGESLRWQGVARESETDGRVVALRLQTNHGDIDCRYHPARPDAPRDAKRLGVVWVGGAGGGLDGPARGLYPAASERLQERDIASLRLHYRRPNDLVACTLDTLAGVAFLVREGATAVAVVGHSFGGAVVISAGAVSPHVGAVVPMSSQTYGTDLAPRVAPRPMLLIHGTSDEVLPDTCSRQIYAAAREPKEIKLYRGARHGLAEVRQEVLDLLVRWIPEQLAKR